jgi:hypothetical protein
MDCENCGPIRAESEDGAKASGDVGTVGRRRGDRAWRKLRNFDSPLAVVTLTVPEELRHLVTPEIVREAWPAVFACVEAWVLGCEGLNGWRLAGVGWFHPCGDSDSERWHPHWNVVFPLVAVSPEGMEWRELTKWRDKEKDFPKLRAAWSGTLGLLLGARVEKEYDVHYAFKESDSEKLHVLQYNSRSFPGWSAWTKYTRWLGFLNAAPWARGVGRLLVAAKRWKTPVRGGGPCDVCGQPIRVIFPPAFWKEPFPGVSERIRALRLVTTDPPSGGTVRP